MLAGRSLLHRHRGGVCADLLLSPCAPRSPAHHICSIRWDPFWGASGLERRDSGGGVAAASRSCPIYGAVRANGGAGECGASSAGSSQAAGRLMQCMATCLWSSSKAGGAWPSEGSRACSSSAPSQLGACTASNLAARQVVVAHSRPDPRQHADSGPPCDRMAVSCEDWGQGRIPDAYLQLTWFLRCRGVPVLGVMCVLPSLGQRTQSSIVEGNQLSSWKKLSARGCEA